MTRPSILKFGLCCAAAVTTHLGLFHALSPGSHEAQAQIEGDRLSARLVSSTADTSHMEKVTPSPAVPVPEKTPPVPAKTAAASPKPPPPDKADSPAKEKTKQSHEALKNTSATPDIRQAAQQDTAGSTPSVPPQGQTNEPHETAAPTANQPAMATPAQGVPAREAGNADTTNYSGAVMKHLSRIRRPRASGAGSTVVAFKIAYSGDLEHCDISRSSGSRRFDRDALRLVERAAPYPTPPTHVNRSFEVKIEGR